MKTLNEEKSISIFDCAWNKDTRVLDSSIPISYNYVPPQRISVIGKTQTIWFECRKSDSLICRTIYVNVPHGITLHVPWWNERRNRVVKKN